MGVPTGIVVRDFGESHPLRGPHQTRAEANHDQQPVDDALAIIGGTFVATIGVLDLQMRLTDKKDKISIATRFAHRKAKKEIKKLEA
jgi:Zn-finger domain-containing protein